MLAVLPVVFACAKGGEAPADSAAMAAAPAPVTDADVAGTWTGMFKPDGQDSTFAFTDICGGGTCRLIAANAPTDTVTSTYTIDADSVHGVSTPYVDKTMGNATLIDHWIARPKAGQVTGRGWMVLASKPDSVVLRYTFTATRNP
jgi:hypothetical protein